MIFTDSKVKVEKKYINPQFYSTTFTDSSGYFTHAHCLIVYEKVTPSSVELSKDRRASDKDYGLDFTENISQETYTYVPTLICMLTKSSYIDLFREILQSLYLSYINYNRSCSCQFGNLVGSLEFIKYVFFLLNEVTIPPCNISLSIKMCDRVIEIPPETLTSLPHSESCIALLMDLVDIASTINFWESTLLNSHVFLLCSNEYLLFLILDAFKQLIFPMNWTLTIIPVLSPQMKDYMNAITPIMIGINSKKISKEQAKIEEGDATILDVDSSSLYSKNESLLCECMKKEIFSKLQLAKVYYYVNNERLFTYGMESLEENVSDKDFVMRVREMARINGEKDKEKAFVELVRRVFFDFFKKISDYKKFMVYDDVEDEYVFQAEKFIDQVEVCSNPQCKMPKFWKSFLESMTFQEFLFYYKKNDDSYMKRFNRILKNQQKPIDNSATYYHHCIFPNISQNLLVKSFENIGRTVNLSAYAKKSFSLLLDDINDILGSHGHYYESPKREGSLRFGNQTFSQTLIDEDCCNDQIFYGEFGIIRISKILLSALNENNFDEFYLNFGEENLENDIWERVLLNLNSMLKQDPSRWNLEKALDLLMKLNSMNPKALPKFYAVLCIEMAQNKDPNLLKRLSTVDGVLQRMLGSFFESMNKPYDLRRTVSVSTIRHSVSLPPLQMKNTY